MSINAFNLNELIQSDHSNIVAVNPGKDGSARLYRRSGDGVSVEDLPFRPFMVLENASYLDEFDGDVAIKELTADSYSKFTCLAEFPDMAVFADAKKFLKTTTGKSATAPNSPYLVMSDMAQQLFVQQRFRLFRQMAFQDVRRLQFDIETITTEGYEFPNPQREGDQIVIITMSDNTGWECCLHAGEMDEKQLLQAFVDAVNERDPDVLEGHNIFRFDLPFIETRAKRHKVKLNLGRDGSKMTARSSRFSAAERTINYKRYDVVGRHIVDTFHLVQLYDVSHRDLEEYGLKAVARHFKVAAPQRTYVKGEDITRLWFEERETLLKYAMDDVRETLAIANILAPSYFYQTQLVPLSYQNCVVRGNATRIDALLTAEYLSHGSALPDNELDRQYAGALTKAFEEGVFKQVWHCDVRSLYPSIILAEKMCPARDSLGIFPKVLDKLRTFRLNAKDSEKAAGKIEDKDFFNSLQTTFKILINSFYGYLAFSQGRFNDFSMAEQVTAKGREILTAMLEFLQQDGATVIEMDTDGIYFQPPESVASPEDMEQRVQAVLPEGIEVELDSVYKAMFSYKSKNYALLTMDDEVAITGAALKSRGLEPFQRQFIKEFVSMLLHDDHQELMQLEARYKQKIEERSFPLEMLAKRENLNDSLETYKRKMSSGKGRRSAAYELAVSSGREYRQGDQVSYYVIGDKKRVSVVDNSKLLAAADSQSRDENVPYYLNKLNDLIKKFDKFMPQQATDGNQLSFDF